MKKKNLSVLLAILFVCISHVAISFASNNVLQGTLTQVFEEYNEYFVEITLESGEKKYFPISYGDKDEYIALKNVKLRINTKVVSYYDEHDAEDVAETLIESYDVVKNYLAPGNSLQGTLTQVFEEYNEYFIEITLENGDKKYFPISYGDKDEYLAVKNAKLHIKTKVVAYYDEHDGEDVVETVIESYEVLQ